MPSFRTSRPVPFTAEQMFSVVADVERYPEFLPLVEGLRITSHKDIAEGHELVATMTVGYKAIRESFTTRVRLTPAARKIRVDYLDGPFSHLENTWDFVAAGDGCNVSFFIDYAFRSPLLGLVAGAAFDKAVRSYTSAFEARARKLYGGAAAV